MSSKTTRKSNIWILESAIRKAHRFIKHKCNSSISKKKLSESFVSYFWELLLLQSPEFREGYIRKVYDYLNVGKREEYTTYIPDEFYRFFSLVNENTSIHNNYREIQEKKVAKNFTSALMRASYNIGRKIQKNRCEENEEMIKKIIEEQS